MCMRTHTERGRDAHMMQWFLCMLGKLTFAVKI